MQRFPILNCNQHICIYFPYFHSCQTFLKYISSQHLQKKFKAYKNEKITKPLYKYVYTYEISHRCLRGEGLGQNKNITVFQSPLSLISTHGNTMRKSNPKDMISSLFAHVSNKRKQRKGKYCTYINQFQTGYIIIPGRAAVHIPGC